MLQEPALWPPWRSTAKLGILSEIFLESSCIFCKGFLTSRTTAWNISMGKLENTEVLGTQVAVKHPEHK